MGSTNVSAGGLKESAETEATPLCPFSTGDPVGVLLLTLFLRGALESIGRTEVLENLSIVICRDQSAAKSIFDGFGGIKINSLKIPWTSILSHVELAHFHVSFKCEGREIVDVEGLEALHATESHVGLAVLEDIVANVY
jgi:hypothetical protein